jgi:phage tail-like protein
MSIRNRLLPIGLVAFVAFATLGVVAFAPGARAAKETFDRSKPHVNVGIVGDGLEAMQFQSVSGLGVETEVVEDPTTARKRPGRTTYSNITLKRGYTSDTELYDWSTEGTRGELVPRDLRLALLGPSAEPLATFELQQCFPTKWEAATDEGDQGRAVETIVLSCERIILVRE